MKDKNNLVLIEKELASGRNKKNKLIAMLAPSFASEFDYPCIVNQLKELGFELIVELTFGAKLVNHEYHKILEKPENKNKMFISSVCPGIVSFIKEKYPNYIRNLMPVDSPMIATAKVCKKFYPKYKTIFISPCQFKKIESKESKFVDYVIDYGQLHQLIENKNIPTNNCKVTFDRFYNDYTKIYPLSGGLSKTAHVKGILNKNETIILDGVSSLDNFMKNPRKNIRFIDSGFCIGGCVGGPCLSKNKSLKEKKKRLMNYLEIAKHEKIPQNKKGLLEKARGINFSKKY
jgi:iron only hydrogenase large subunit-like protein